MDVAKTSRSVKTKLLRKEAGSVSNGKSELNRPISSPTAQNLTISMAVKSAGYRAVGSTIYDSDNGVHYHQNFAATCKNLKKDKPCLVKLCNKCLLNRYGEKMEEIAGLEEWVCPKCRGICNCSVCIKRGKENSFDRQLDAHLPESAGKKVKGLLNGKAVDNTTSEICNQNPDMIVLNQEGLKGTDLTSVAGIDMPAEDVGNALELLELCYAFGKAIDCSNW